MPPGCLQGSVRMLGASPMEVLVPHKPSVSLHLLHWRAPGCSQGCGSSSLPPLHPLAGPVGQLCPHVWGGCARPHCAQLADAGMGAWSWV